MTHAATFRALHAGPALLILPNAWDAGSARLMASLGARAIATTSAAVAWSHGWPDGDALPVELLIRSVSAIAGAVDLPVSADVEGGYSDDPGEVVATVARVAEAGAVGINLEDGDGPPALLVAKLAAIRAAGLRLFVNARVDVYLRGLVTGEAARTETLARLQRYADAGADGVFVPGLVDPGVIADLAAATPLPFNVLARPGLPDAAGLVELGVRRLSAGSGIAQAAWAEARRQAAAFLASGDSTALAAANYAELNAIMRN